MKHSKVCAHLQHSICKAPTRHWNDTCTCTHAHARTHKPVCEHEDVTVLWNQGVHIDRDVMANRPDIIIKKKSCILIDVTIPADRNVMQKEAEKKLQYKSLCIELQQMWNMKCMITPLIIGATRIVTKGLKKNLEAILRKHSIDSLQKIDSYIGTSHIIQKVL